VPTPRLHHLDFPPELLPPVAPSELVRAWKAAALGAKMELELQSGDIEGVAFATPTGEVRFLFADLDASCWAAALDELYGLDTLRGVTVLFRLLALVEIMSRAEWLRPFFKIERDGETDLDTNLIQAAAHQPLSGAAMFDTISFKSALNIGSELSDNNKVLMLPQAKASPKPAKRGRPRTKDKGSRKG